ncbi:hypothetical protein NDU88_005206 [Pleurodeles waltl]|uniref:Uncharacterized protein n=1 Tax=Pleurodeles waltl TaxID=8319 RepID=A0AAV7LM09_PLEWA|nr:hypothetical protein NDU88_005206 [Pleurodeles waltl]
MLRRRRQCKRTWPRATTACWHVEKNDATLYQEVSENAGRSLAPLFKSSEAEPCPRVKRAQHCKREPKSLSTIPILVFICSVLSHYIIGIRLCVYVDA